MKASVQTSNSTLKTDALVQRLQNFMELTMDNVIANDLALAFQLVSEKEKKTNTKIVEIAKELVSTLLEFKELKRKKDAKE
jgi:hypothetical protein